MNTATAIILILFAAAFTAVFAKTRKAYRKTRVPGYRYISWILVPLILQFAVMAADLLTPDPAIHQALSKASWGVTIVSGIITACVLLQLRKDNKIKENGNDNYEK